VTVQQQVGQRGGVPARADLACISNADALLDHGLADLRAVALDVITAGLRSADPGQAVDRMVDVDGRYLTVDGRCYDLDAVRSIVVLGAGKASQPIAAALEGKLGDRISRGLVVRRAGASGTLRRIEALDADHPVPSEASLVAGRRLVELAAGCGPGDLLITAFTGGSSALACLPPEGVSFEDKRALHAALLDSGASIEEVNTVRKHVSGIKGGRLAALARGATILNFTLSDVVGDALDLLCDAAVQDTTEPADAAGVLHRYGLWDVVAPQIRAHLGSAAACSPSLAGEDIMTCMLVTGSTVVERMAERTRAIGWTPVVLGTALAGDAVTLGGVLGVLAAGSSLLGRPFVPGSVLIAAGGEATVSIRRAAGARVGRGGPNQEVALGFAKAAAGQRVRVAGAFIDSDGSDGGTDSAGGCVDNTSVARAAARHVDLDAAIACHDAMTALERTGDVVLTGATGTNISDLVAITIGRPLDRPREIAADGTTVAGVT
jgi:glycerate 2-kinase